MVIGIYDSGLGGLSVWRELRGAITTRLVYFGDTANVPYGEKSSAELVSYFWRIYSFFRKQGCDAVVVACNTSSALVLPEVRDKVELPVFGVIEAAVDLASQVSRDRVGILATRGTIESGVYQRAFRETKPHLQVVAQSAPRLVPLIEQGQTAGPEVEAVLREYLEPLQKQAVDTLLLGCTHYPFLSPLIKELVGPKVEVVDPAPSLASLVKTALDAGGVGGKATTEFYVSSQPKKFQHMAELLLQEEVPEVRLEAITGEGF